MGRLLSAVGIGAGLFVIGSLGPIAFVLVAPNSTVLAALLAVGTVCWIGVARRDDLVRSLGSHPFTSALLLVPLATVIAAELLATTGIASEGAADFGGFFGMAAGGGAILVSRAQQRDAEVRFGADEPLVTWRARPAPGRTGQRFLIGTVLLAVPAGSVVAWLGGATLSLPFSPIVTFALFLLPAALGVLALVGVLPSEHEAYDAGLRLAGTSAVLGRTIPATSVVGYAVTDDALIVYRDRWGLPTIRFDRNDIEDLEALIDVFERYGIDDLVPTTDGIERYERRA